MQAFKQQYLVLSAQTYRIEDEKTKQVNEGVSIRYIPDDNLDPTKDERQSANGNYLFGKKVAKASLPVGYIEKFQYLPGLYDVTLEMTIVADKQQIRVKDMELISTVKLTLNKPRTAA
jgi:hypothetical protein